MFDERRYFTPGQGTCVFQVEGVSVGILVCEDAWFDEPGLLAREAGAEIRTEAPIAQIILKNGAAKGVVLQNGDELYADIVSSSVDPRLTFMKMVGEEQPRPEAVIFEYTLNDTVWMAGDSLDAGIVVETLHETRPSARVVVLTGFGNIATAVAAVKFGAIDYLSKPADADDILGALLAAPGAKPSPPENPMSADRVRWEHIQRVYELCGHNVSETARRLNMHRRTLQRILAKRSPR